MRASAVLCQPAHCTHALNGRTIKTVTAARREISDRTLLGCWTFRTESNCGDSDSQCHPNRSRSAVRYSLRKASTSDTRLPAKQPWGPLREPSPAIHNFHDALTLQRLDEKFLGNADGLAVAARTRVLLTDHAEVNNLMVIEPYGYRQTRVCPTRCYVPRACGSHATRNTRASGARRSLSRGAGGAVRDEPARHFQTPEDARTGGADQCRTGCATAASTNRGKTACRSDRLAREVSGHLGSKLRASRGSVAGAAAPAHRIKAQPQTEETIVHRGEGREGEQTCR